MITNNKPKKAVYKFTLDGTLITEVPYPSCKEAAEENGGTYHGLYSAVRGRKQYKGFLYAFTPTWNG